MNEDKSPRPAASYAILYPNLCEVVRPLGYCLTLHGSMINDLDLVAIPWVEDAVEPEQVAEAIKKAIDGFTDWDRQPGRAIAHGRMQWLIWFKGLDHAKGGRACIDLSIMPKNSELIQEREIRESREDVIAMIAENLKVEQEPHQTFLERLIEASHHER